MKLNNNSINITKTDYYFTTMAVNNHNEVQIKYNTLDQCYNNFSSHKECAFNYCIDLLNTLKDCKSIDIINYGISSYNIFQFTYTINAIFKAHLISFYITRDSNKIISDKATIKLLLETLKCEKNIYILD